MPYDYYVTPEEYETAKQNGIPPNRVDYRIRNYGWDKRDAISEPPKVMKPLNEKYVSLAEKNGISRETFRFRVRRYGMTNKEAATKPLQNKQELVKKMHKKRRKYSDEILNLMKKNGIKYSTFCARINRYGWEPLKAATTPIISPQESGENGKKAYELVLKGGN